MAREQLMPEAVTAPAPETLTVSVPSANAGAAPREQPGGDPDRRDDLLEMNPSAQESGGCLAPAWRNLGWI